jgi:chromosome segregation ATPase
MNKYEKLIEYIINDQESKARELFHEIVVEKSRDIYESLLDDEQLEAVGGNEVEELVDEITADEEGIAEEDMEFDAEEGDEDMDIDADAEFSDEISDEESSEEDLEDKVMDLEDALDELKAEFDKLMGEMNPDEADSEESEEKPFGESKEEVAEEDEESEEEVKEGQAELDKLREYVEKIAAPSNTEGADNKSSVVAKKNDMGGSAKNLAQGGEEQGAKAKAPATINSGNKNVPGAKAGSLEKAPAPKTGE